MLYFSDLLLKWSKKDGFQKNQTLKRPDGVSFEFGLGFGEF